MTDSFAAALELEMLDDVPVARLAQAHGVFEHVVDLITDAIRRVVAENRPHLLVDVGNARFAPPSTVERLRMVREWAAAADGRLRIAVVARPEFIDPDRFGVVAAGNFGLAGQVFEREADALAWLHDERVAQARRTAPLPRS